MLDEPLENLEMNQILGSKLDLPSRMLTKQLFFSFY